MKFACGREHIVCAARGDWSELPEAYAENIIDIDCR